MTREIRIAQRRRSASTLLTCAFAMVVALGCAHPNRVQSSGSRLVELSCSPLNPLMQTHVLEAVVAGGGPNSVDVAGWMCGRQRFGYVRVVMLAYTPDDRRQAKFVVPVVFEHGAMVAFGWHLLEAQPDRYGAVELPDRDHPWRTPAGWSCRRHAQSPEQGPR